MKRNKERLPNRESERGECLDAEIYKTYREDLSVSMATVISVSPEQVKQQKESFLKGQIAGFGVCLRGLFVVKWNKLTS